MMVMVVGDKAATCPPVVEGQAGDRIHRAGAMLTAHDRYSLRSNWAIK